MTLKVGDKLLSLYFGQPITIVRINSDEDWEFEIQGHIEKARTPLSYFERRPELVLERV